MLLALRIHLKALGRCGYPGGGGQLTHAAVLRLIEAVDPAVSREVHDRLYPITTSGLRKANVAPLSQVTVSVGERVWVRVGVVGEPACVALLAALSPTGLVIPVGHIDFAVEHVEYDVLACANPTAIEALLLDAGQRTDPMRVVFESATSFSRQGLSLAMPVPESVFGRGRGSIGGLYARWRDAGGTDLDGFRGERLGARIVSHKAHRVRVYASQQPVDAFRGIAEYSADTSDDQQAMWALGLFAQFSGVGVARSMGMGQVRVGAGHSGL
ncbi:MAG: CRISPR system precrRNA processing endoribonuclease RAMP protein Cas6 [Coriobacteriia bacterium]|nr:CRISPR system precrRNA processing endoribonuclease RAMP protein Cas6 [Coriobacteriia bacterium]